ncbi:MAG: universal stress protein [Anaerolineales bacterium]
MRILIATNDTSHSKVATQYGLMLAKRTGAKLTLMHVIRNLDERSIGNARLKEQGKLARRLGLKADLILRTGLPAEQIIHYAHEGEEDLIVLGGGSRASLLRRTIAPTAERVVANAPCPVLIVRSSRRQALNFLILHSGQEGLATIERFLGHAGKLIRKKCNVTLLHVMSQMGASYKVEDWELRAEADELIRKGTLEGKWLKQGMAVLKRGRKVQIVPKVRHGLVIDEILKEVEQGDYDVVVLGSHRKGGWTDILMDDISKQVIARVKRPVLIVQGKSG